MGTHSLSSSQKIERAISAGEFENGSASAESEAETFGPSIYAVTEQYIKPTTALAKVLNSWPVQARPAWCCMLANPQNLNIAALLESPSSSPFALALAESEWVLVVPSRRTSVHMV